MFRAGHAVCLLDRRPLEGSVAEHEGIAGRDQAREEESEEGLTARSTDAENNDATLRAAGVSPRWEL
jgi:hypothetical protein